MQLTTKLLGYLNSVFDKDPEQFLALRFNYDGEMVWKVLDGRLTTATVRGSGVDLDIDLSAHTIGSLSALLAAQAGYSIPYQVSGAQAGLSAMVLIDGSGDPATSNGDHIYAFTSLLWAYLNAAGVELYAARMAIQDMLKQMSISTAQGEWLDDLGVFYGVPRYANEEDLIYGNRIIAEVIKPKNNNKAMELALSQALGGVPVSVTDVATVETKNVLDGSWVLDGSHTLSSVMYSSYNLFDVDTLLPLTDSLDIQGYIDRVKAIIERIRAAGTHLRSIVASSVITDTATIPTDGDLVLYQGTFVNDAGLLDGSRLLDGSWTLGEIITSPLDGTLPLDGLWTLGGLWAREVVTG